MNIMGHNFSSEAVKNMVVCQQNEVDQWQMVNAQ